SATGGPGRQASTVTLPGPSSPSTAWTKAGVGRTRRVRERTSTSAPSTRRRSARGTVPRCVSQIARRAGSGSGCRSPGTDTRHTRGSGDQLPGARRTLDLPPDQERRAAPQVRRALPEELGKDRDLDRALDVLDGRESHAVAVLRVDLPEGRHEPAEEHARAVLDLAELPGPHDTEPPGVVPHAPERVAGEGEAEDL